MASTRNIVSHLWNWGTDNRLKQRLQSEPHINPLEVPLASRADLPANSNSCMAQARAIFMMSSSVTIAGLTYLSAWSHFKRVQPINEKLNVKIDEIEQSASQLSLTP